MQSHSVKYPICVVSKGRAPHMITPDALMAAGLNFWMFVPAGQAEAYDQYHPYCVPNEASLAQTRQEIITYGKMENAKKVWILDDDLIFMKPVEETLGLVEYMADQYTNIIMASPAMENADPYPTWNIDKVSPTKCMLVSTETDFPFRHHDEFPMMSHIEFQLEHLITNGWHVLVDYRNRIGTKFLPGGMNWAYLADNGKLPQKASAILHEKYKTYTHLDSNGLLVIDWKHFSTGAMPKALHRMLVGDK